MNDPRTAKYEEMLRRAIAALDGLDATQRAAGYHRMRHANETMLTKPDRGFDPVTADRLRASLEGLIAEHDRAQEEADVTQVLPGADVAPAPAETVADNVEIPAAGTARSGRSMLAGVAVGVIAMAVLAGALWFSGVVALSAAQERPSNVAASLEKAYLASLPKVEAAANFLEVARQEVERLQQADPERLKSAAGQKYVRLDVISPDVAARQPETLPSRSVLTIRADGTAYKILYNWPLCAAVQQARPDLVDPVRNEDFFGCSHFGVWNEAGAEW